MEISIDDGASWRLSELIFPEEKLSHAPRYGYYYCWMFWELDVDISELISAAGESGEIRARAWDASNNMQPEKIIWNLLEYGNNCQYTVKMSLSEEKYGKKYITFSHLTVAGASTNGWMITNKNTIEAETEVFSSDSIASDRPISLDEISRHNKRDSAWIIVDGKVYDTTEYLDDHPGGAASILVYAGQDASVDFNDIHSDTAKSMLLKYQIGVVADSSYKYTPVTGAHEKQVVVSKGSFALGNDSFTDLKLESVEKLSKTLRVLKFKLPSKVQSLGLPVGGHLLARAVVDGKPVPRAYTPISSDNDLGYFKLGVKVYYPSTQYPKGGKMSQHMDKMKVGDSLTFTGP